jgi:NAD(P)-dependent dehydrogenase (short-subunit alcohol dehydrogenase family)
LATQVSAIEPSLLVVNRFSPRPTPKVTLMRLKDKVTIVVGAGQTPGDTIGNGRAIAILFAREGARVLVVDRVGSSARELLAMIEREGGRATVFVADATRGDECRAMAEACLAEYGSIDVVHNNVGIAAGDSDVGSLGGGPSLRPSESSGGL